MSQPPAEPSSPEPDKNPPPKRSAAADLAGEVAATAATEGGCCLASSVLGSLSFDCFVATASLQPADARTHPDLVALRALRDTVLQRSAAGRAFTRLYYRWGRYPARAIQGRPVARFIVREGLVRPMAQLARYVLARRKA